MSESIVAQKRPADELLARLDAVRQTGPGRWQARCPAHEDRDPSLSIRETPDGRVLLFCHAGCDTTSVLAALGLSWNHLFPENLGARNQECRVRESERDFELMRRFDLACRNAGVRLLHLCRIAENVLAREGPAAWEDEDEGLSFWIENLPNLRDLRDMLFEGTAEERLSALREVHQLL